MRQGEKQEKKGERKKREGVRLGGRERGKEGDDVLLLLFQQAG